MNPMKYNAPYLNVRSFSPLPEALNPAFFHGAGSAADLWPHPFSAYAAAANQSAAENQLHLHQQALLHPALQGQLPVRSFL